MQVERRRDPRLELRCPIRFRAPGSGARGRSVTQNVSARGAYFRTVAWGELQVGDELEVSLAVAQPGASGAQIDLSGRGRVARIEAPADVEELSVGGVALEFESALDLVPFV